MSSFPRSLLPSTLQETKVSYRAASYPCRLSSEILETIFKLVDRSTLLACIKVSREFRYITTRILFSTLQIDPTLFIRGKDTRGNFRLVCFWLKRLHPNAVKYVTKVRLTLGGRIPVHPEDAFQWQHTSCIASPVLNTIVATFPRLRQLCIEDNASVKTATSLPPGLSCPRPRRRVKLDSVSFLLNSLSFSNVALREFLSSNVFRWINTLRFQRAEYDSILSQPSSSSVPTIRMPRRVLPINRLELKHLTALEIEQFTIRLPMEFKSLDISIRMDKTPALAPNVINALLYKNRKSLETFHFEINLHIRYNMNDWLDHLNFLWANHAFAQKLEIPNLAECKSLTQVHFTLYVMPPGPLYEPECNLIFPYLMRTIHVLPPTRLKRLHLTFCLYPKAYGNPITSLSALDWGALDVVVQQHQRLQKIRVELTCHNQLPACDVSVKKGKPYYGAPADPRALQTVDWRSYCEAVAAVREAVGGHTKHLLDFC